MNVVVLIGKVTLMTIKFLAPYTPGGDMIHPFPPPYFMSHAPPPMLKAPPSLYLMSHDPLFDPSIINVLGMHHVKNLTSFIVYCTTTY